MDLRDVGPAKIGGLAIALDQLVQGVDVEHVAQESEGEVRLDEACVVQEVGNLGRERKDLVLGALGPAAKVLAGILGNPNVASKGVVHVVDVVDEALSVGVIVVHSDCVQSAATVASFQKVLQPLLSRGGVRAGRRNSAVTKLALRFNVSLP